MALLLFGISATSWGQYLSFSEYSVPSANSTPGCIAQGPDGAMWFTETGVFANNIGRVTTAGAITEYPIPTFNSVAYCITAGPDGAMWFTEQFGNKIGRITTAGVITEYAIPTTGSHPWGITAGPDGAIWFAEQYGNKIGQITTSGTITEYTVPTANSYPLAITAGPDGALWFTEQFGNKIGRITTAGVVTEHAISTSFAYPWGITAGPDGALWFTEEFGNSIGRITTTRFAVTEFPVPSAGSYPLLITAGSDGALYFTEQYGNNIGRITTSGTITEFPVPEVPGSPFGISSGPNGTLWFTDDGPNSIFQATIVAEPPALSIFTASPLPKGSVGVSYNQSLSATGGVPPYSWIVSAGALPAGLSLNSSAQIAGTPTASGTANFTIQVTDSNQTTATKAFSLTIDANNISQFALPLTYAFGGITSGPDGALWFTESTSGNNTNQVGRITTAGEITEYPVTPCNCPGGLGAITAGPDGALWFAAGTSVGQITTAGVVTQYPIPNAVEIDGITTGPDGALWFTDYSSDYIGRITTAGAITQYPVPPHGESNGINAIAAGSDGALWFGEAAGYVGRITTAGVVTEFAVQALVTDITAGPDGALWFSAANGGVGRITTAGVVVEYPTPSGSYLLGITSGPDRALWFTEADANNIGRITTSAAITEYPIPTADVGSPGSITAGPDGAVWFTQSGRGESLLGSRNEAVRHSKLAKRISSGSGGAIGRILPAPTLSTINPTTGAQGDTVPVVLTGISFVPGATTVNAPAGITLSNLNAVSTTQVAVTFNIASNAIVGPVSVTVTTAAGTSQPVTFTVTPPPQPPSVTSVIPGSGVQGTSVPVVLTGTNFTAAPTITATNFFNDYSQLVPLTQTPAMVDNGLFTVTSTVYPDPVDSNSQWIDFNFQSVSGGALASNPNGFWQAYLTNIPLTVPGTFTGVQYYWTVNGTAAPNITAVSGLYPVVTNQINPALGQAYGSTFQGAALLSTIDVFTSLTNYTTALQEGGMNPGAVNGFHLAARTTGGAFGAAVVAIGNPGVLLSNVTLVSATEITAVLNIAATAALGPANVAVSNANGTSTPSPAATFTVLPPKPTLTGISPPSGAQGTTVPVTLTGTNFVAGATVFVNNPGISVTNVVVASDTQITATFTIAIDAAVSQDNVLVTTAGGTTLPAVFTVHPPPPSLTAITPPSAAPGTSVQVALTGTNFVSGASIAVSAAGVTASSVTVVSATQITATFIIGSAAVPGPATVTVTTANGTSGSVTFTIVSLLLTSVSPTGGVQGASVPVILTGVGFAAGALVVTSSPDVTASNVIVVSATQITATVKISTSAASGTVGIAVVVAGVTSASVPFAVGNTNAVSLTSISPPAGPQGASVPVTLTGAGFVTGAQITISNAGVTAGSITVVSPTQITATFMIAADAALGPANVAVSTPAGSSGQVPFTVIAPLKLTSISPAAGAQGSSVPVTLTGAGFAQGAHISVSNSGVTAGDIVVVNSTTITATFTIDAAASLGADNVTVIVSGFSSASVAFTVSPPPPTLTAISAANAPQGSSLKVTLTGTNFVAGATINSGNTGIIAANVTVVSVTQITATLTIAVDAALGATTLAVHTPGGTSASLSFTVNPAVTFSISGLSGNISSGQQVPFTVSIAQAYPEDLSGELTLQFTPSQSLPPDPMITLEGGTCSDGKCTVVFQIPASQTSAPLSLQTGTVAGTLAFSIGTVTVGGTAVTLVSTPNTSVSVPAQAPGITGVSIQPQSSGFDIVVTGFSNTREITEADFTFTPTSGSQLTSSTFSLTNVASTFQSYYASDASLAVGSEFIYTQTFNLTAGSIGTLQSVTVTLKSAQGTSSTATANF